MSSEHKDFTSTSTSTSTPAQPRTVAPTKSEGALDVTSLVTVAVLIAAGLILDLTVGKAISAIGIGPEFVIASFCLAIIVLKPRAVQSIIIGLGHTNYHVSSRSRPCCRAHLGARHACICFRFVCKKQDHAFCRLFCYHHYLRSYFCSHCNPRKTCRL